MENIIIEFETIWSSRSVTRRSADLNHFIAITPVHFLIDEAMTNVVDGHAEESKSKKWKALQLRPGTKPQEA